MGERDNQPAPGDKLTALLNKARSRRLFPAGLTRREQIVFIGMGLGMNDQAIARFAGIKRAAVAMRRLRAQLRLDIAFPRLRRARRKVGLCSLSSIPGDML